jgi:hypothetical protein
MADAAAIERTTTPTQITHRAGLNVPVSYQAEIKEPVHTFKTAVGPTELRAPERRGRADRGRRPYRPLVVIDDTDRFARLDSDGGLQTDSIQKLLTNAVHVLCEVEPRIDVIVAVHPRYEDVPGYDATGPRFRFVVLETPRLPLTRSV